jgi:hypothetical protein
MLKKKLRQKRRSVHPVQLPTRAAVPHGVHGGELGTASPVVSWRRPTGRLLTINRAELPPGVRFARDIVGTDGVCVLSDAGSLLIWEALP